MAGTAFHGLPSEYCTPVASDAPPAESDANGTSNARLNSRTAEPFVGGTNDAAIVSTFFGSLGGQLSLITTTKGPGVRGIFVLSSTLPVPCSLTVIVPEPPWKMLTQSENCEKR